MSGFKVYDEQVFHQTVKADSIIKYEKPIDKSLFKVCDESPKSMIPILKPVVLETHLCSCNEEINLYKHVNIYEIFQDAVKTWPSVPSYSGHILYVNNSLTSAGKLTIRKPDDSMIILEPGKTLGGVEFKNQWLWL